MCIGTPMQVIEMRESHALCEANGKQELVDMMLVGDQSPGTWVLNFLGSAREVLLAENAKQITQALSAVDQIMNGEIGGLDSHQQVSSLFADIAESGPRLPPHLQAQLPQNSCKQKSTSIKPDQSNSTTTRQESP